MRLKNQHKHKLPDPIGLINGFYAYKSRRHVREQCQLWDRWHYRYPRFPTWRSMDWYWLPD